MLKAIGPSMFLLNSFNFIPRNNLGTFAYRNRFLSYHSSGIRQRLPVYRISTAEATINALNALNSECHVSPKKIQSKSELLQKLSRVAFLHLSSRQHQNNEFLAVLHQNIGLLFFQLNNVQIVEALISNFFNSDRMLKVRFLQVCVSLTDTVLSLSRRFPLLSSRSNERLPRNCIDLEIAYGVIFGETKLVPDLPELLAAFCSTDGISPSLTNLSCRFLSVTEILRAHVGRTAVINQSVLKALNETSKLRRRLQYDEKFNKMRDVNNIENEGEMKRGGINDYETTMKLLTRMYQSVDEIERKFRKSDNILEIYIAKTNTVPLVFMDKLRDIENIGFKRTEIWSNLSTTNIATTETKEFEGIFLCRKDRQSYFYVNGDSSSYLAIVMDAPAGILDRWKPVKLEIENINKSQRLIWGKPITIGSQEDAIDDEIAVLRTREIHKRRTILSQRDPIKKLKEPIDLRDYPRHPYQHRREDTEAQVDWDDPKELPGGRTQLPQIGDILDRRGRRRPRLRRRLPKGIWDADGNILPLQGDNRT